MSNKPIISGLLFALLGLLGGCATNPGQSIEIWIEGTDEGPGRFQVEPGPTPWSFPRITAEGGIITTNSSYERQPAPAPAPDPVPEDTTESAGKENL